MFGRRLGTGDEGFTDLMGPKRVAKYDLRPETYGTLDEATSALGLARVLAPLPGARKLVSSDRFPPAGGKIAGHSNTTADLPMSFR